MATNPSGSKATEPKLDSQPQMDVFIQEHLVHLNPNTGSTAANVEVDRDLQEDGDSAYDGSSVVSDTTTVSSSVFSYTYANGRRYHSDRFKKADYFLPNDEIEQDRLDMYHHIFMLMLGGKLHIAPLEKPQRILDVGTGTGIWAIETAMDNPQAEVVGTDISPIQPTMVPVNCTFEVDDMEETWTYPKDHFDYIHMRCLAGSFADWDFVLQQTFDHLQPGGIFEFQDCGWDLHFNNGQPTTGSDTPMARLLELEVSGAGKLGRPVQIAQTLKTRMAKVGFVDIHENVAVWPLGDWPKDKNLKVIGKWSRIGALESLETYAVPLLTRGHGWTVSQAMELVKEVAHDLRRSSPNRYYLHGWFLWGRKPRVSGE